MHNFVRSRNLLEYHDYSAPLTTTKPLAEPPAWPLSPLRIALARSRSASEATSSPCSGIEVRDGPAILDGLDGVPRWVSVEMDDRAEIQRGDTLVLAYRATARREGAAPYAAFCSSTYLRAGKDWELIAHQQTPI